MPIVRFSIHISGRVQGVFFRDAAKSVADSLGVAGSVWNESDGSVRAEGEGEESLVRQFVDWCHHGPPPARVENVKIEEGKVEGLKGFLVKR